MLCHTLPRALWECLLVDGGCNIACVGFEVVTLLLAEHTLLLAELYYYCKFAELYYYMEVIGRLLFRERGRKQDMLWQVHSRTAYYRYRILVQPVTLFLYTYTAYVYHHSISIITIYTIYTTILHACSASSTTTPAIYAMQLTGATCPLGNTPVIPYAIMHIYTIPALRTQSAGHSRYSW